MSNPRLIHDSAHRLAQRLLGIIAPCLREEEHRDAYGEFYTVAKEEIEAYEVARERQQKRLYGQTEERT